MGLKSHPSIAGGFALVFAAQEQSGRSYALKQQIAKDKDALSALSNEIAVMEEVFI